MRDPLHVAVADDEFLMRLYLHEILTEFGCNVVAVAESGSQLVEQCRAHHPDLVVTDIRMPGMDGVEAVRRICQNNPMPVIFVTGFGEEQRSQLVELGCVLHFLTKPIDEAMLRAAISTVLDRFEQFQQVLREEPDIEAAYAVRQRLEAAKSRLMKQRRVGEKEAFDEIQRVAADKGIRLADAAEEVLAG
jgi:AmiR/NasT family two-component response regulator